MNSEFIYLLYGIILSSESWEQRKHFPQKGLNCLKKTKNLLLKKSYSMPVPNIVLIQQNLTFWHQATPILIPLHSTKVDLIQMLRNPTQAWCLFAQVLSGHCNNGGCRDGEGMKSTSCWAFPPLPFTCSSVFNPNSTHSQCEALLGSTEKVCLHLAKTGLF